MWWVRDAWAGMPLGGGLRAAMCHNVRVWMAVLNPTKRHRPLLSTLTASPCYQRTEVCERLCVSPKLVSWQLGNPLLQSIGIELLAARVRVRHATFAAEHYHHWQRPSRRDHQRLLVNLNLNPSGGGGGGGSCGGGSSRCFLSVCLFGFLKRIK